MPETPPLVELDADGNPSVLNYNVPEPTSFTGRNLIRLGHDRSIFNVIKGAETLPEVEDDADDDTILDHFSDFVYHQTFELPGWVNDPTVGFEPEPPPTDSGPIDPEDPIPDGHGPHEPPRTRMRARAARPLLSRKASDSAPITATPAPGTPPRGTTSPSTGGTTPRSGGGATARMALVNEDELLYNVRNDKYPVVVATQGGSVKLEYISIDRPDPDLYLVETYRLSNFLGDYGAGRTVNTFSLLPGEKTKISIKTYKTATTASSETNTIFDSVTSETIDSFESTVQAENSDKESKEKTTEWYVDAEASGNWGVASASVSGGGSGSTNSARESFARNVSSATEKHAASASAQRNVEVNSTVEQTVETGEETAIEREIQNINVGRTLNFVFRQLNQEFISVLHLVDVRIGFFNGYSDTAMVVPLHEIDRLFDYCLNSTADREQIRADIEFALANIFDETNTPQSFLTVRQYAEQNGSKTAIRVVDKTKTQVYDPDGRAITVDGIILSSKKHVVRTDAVIVEALLGQAPAVDDYSADLQTQKVREKTLANDLAQLQADTEQLRLDIVRAGDEAAAALYERLFPAPIETADDEAEAAPWQAS